MSEDCHLSISNNKIFEHVFWGILCMSRTSAIIKENVIFSNKCGGIFIGFNFSGQISILSNVVRDHAGPWLRRPDEKGSFGGRFPIVREPFLCHLPSGETQEYSCPPDLKSNQEFNNVDGLFHPADDIKGAQSRCCHCLRRFPLCLIAQLRLLFDSRISCYYVSNNGPRLALSRSQQCHCHKLCFQMQ